MSNFAIGVDIGGSHITVAAVDLNLKTVVGSSRARAHVDCAEEAGKIIDAWCQVIRSAMQYGNGPNVRIGIAMPGPFDYEQGISYIRGLGKYENLYGRNVKKMIAEALGIKASEIRLNNDAACFLHGEMFAGAGRGISRSIGVTLGTGAGTAFHQDGTTVDANLGPSPFLESIADNYLSTRWFVNEYRARSGESVNNVRELVARYDSEEIVREIFRTFSENFMLLLKDFIAAQHPEVVIIGGNIANASDRFLPETEELLHKAGIRIPMRKAILGEDAILLGAASLFS